MIAWFYRRGLLRTPVPRRSKTHRLLRRGCLKQSLCTGRGYIAGTAGTSGIVTVNGQPARRRILLFDRSNFKAVRDVWSLPDGTYRLPYLDPDKEYLVLALDNRESGYHPVARDFIRPHTD